MTGQYFSKNKPPDKPGVYIFRNSRKQPLYIGRATSLRDRVKNYAGVDLIVTRGPRIVDMVTKAKSLTWRETDSVLEAVILENALIKRYQPRYNVDAKDNKSGQYVIITDEEWPRVFLVRSRDFDEQVSQKSLPYKVKKRFGPYSEGGLIKEALKVLRKLFPFRDKRSVDPRHDAFYRALGRSPLRNERDAREQYLQTMRHLTLFFEGKKKILRREVKKEMNKLATNMQFEEAGRMKRLLYAMDHINDMALIKSDKRIRSGADPFRIEAYDVAHLSGSNNVGVMTVAINGENFPSEYRKFKISRDTNDDLAGLAEILGRRLNHPEWTYPNLIVVDGNETHLSRAKGVLQARRVDIDIVAVTKDDKHKASRLIGNPDILSKWKREIIATNAEAHRFAISYHRRLRRVLQ